jgi:predicted SAM-dependent methyltransferase
MIGLHLGCGPIRLPSTEAWQWVNVDIEPSHNPDVVMDYLEVDKYYKNVDWIFSCHSIEHIPYPEGVNKAFRAFYNTLKPNGILRLAVPDLELAANEYLHGDARKLYGNDFKGYYHKDCPAERFMYWAREWQHTILFDYQLLSAMLKDAGFTGIIRKCYPNDTEIPGFSYDRFQSESLYVETIK